MVRNSSYLLLIWKDPLSRRNFIVGKLCKGQKYTFEYYGEYGKAQNHGWTKLDAFPEEILYESETLFPVFLSRLPDKKRRDIGKILEKYNLNEFDEFELLSKSEGRLPIDTYSFINPIFPGNQTVQRDFYIMGVRYYAPCKGSDCTLFTDLKLDEDLFFEAEPENQHDANAIKIVTSKQQLLGYVPRYYNLAILEYLHMGISYSCKVININTSLDCSECVKVRLNIPKQ